MEVVVVISTIRVDSWLDEAVNSILNQQGVRFTLVVAHDGVQPDPSRTWMQDSRVVSIHIPINGGLAAALRMAIDQSVGKYIARLDADDYALPGRLVEQYDYLQAHTSTVLVGTQIVRIDDSGNPSSTLDSTVGSDLGKTLLGRNTILHNTVMFRRDAYDVVGGYDPALRVMEDYDMWLRIATTGQIAVLPTRSTAYRVHSRQMSRGAKPYGIHIRKIMASHRQLARVLGVNRARAAILASAWVAAQYLRYWGLRTPRFDK